MRFCFEWYNNKPSNGIICTEDKKEREPQEVSLQHTKSTGSISQGVHNNYHVIICNCAARL